MKTEDAPMKYLAFTPATWAGVVQILLVHWKIAHNLDIPWWMALIPVEVSGIISTFAILYYALGFIASKLTRKTFP
jgi:hypothetical protein